MEWHVYGIDSIVVNSKSARADIVAYFICLHCRICMDPKYQNAGTLTLEVLQQTRIDQSNCPSRQFQLILQFYIMAWAGGPYTEG